MPQTLMRLLRVGLACCVSLFVCACTGPPDLAARQSISTAATPPILPLDELLAQAGPDAGATDPVAELNARAASLSARARALQSQTQVPGT